MEALTPEDVEAANTTRRPPDATDGYLAQPDMRELIQAQAVTVAFAGLAQQQAALVAELAPILDRYDGTAGPLAC